jgi:hypothetical protein
MKAEHRHELAENDLNKVLARWMQRLEPWSNQILLGFLALAVAAVGVVVWRQRSHASRDSGFTQLAACRAADDFATVADEFEGTSPGAWARLRAGEEYLEEGVRLSVSDRAASDERLNQAKTSLDKVLNAGNVPPEVREKALKGMALTLESLSDGETGPAIKAYETLLAEFPNTRYKRWADDRIEVLQSGGAQQFYAWFHKQQPRPEDRPSPLDFLKQQFPDRGAGTGVEESGIPPPPPPPQRATGRPFPLEPESPAEPEPPAATDGADSSSSDAPPGARPGDPPPTGSESP